MDESSDLPSLSSLGIAFDRPATKMTSSQDYKVPASGITALYHPPSGVHAHREGSTLASSATCRLNSPVQASFAPSMAAEKRGHEDNRPLPSYLPESPRGSVMGLGPRHHPYLDARERPFAATSSKAPWSPSAIERMRLSTSPPGPPSAGLAPRRERGSEWSQGPISGRPLDEMMTSTNPMTSVPPYTRLSGKINTPSACAECKRAHLGCDSGRPCRRCEMIGKPELCRDVIPKKRGRPKLVRNASSGNPNEDGQRPGTATARKSSVSLGWQPGSPVRHASPDRLVTATSATTIGRGFSDDPAPGQHHQLPALQRSSISVPALIERRTGKRVRDMEVDTSGLDKQQRLETQYGSLPLPQSAPFRMQRLGSGGATLCTLFTTTTMQIVRCSETAYDTTGFHSDQMEGEAFLRFVHPKDITAIKHLQTSLLGALTQSSGSLDESARILLSRRKSSDLQIPARETQYVDQTIDLIQADGNYQPYNVRMHIGGALGTDLRTMHATDQAYVVVSLLRLEKPREAGVVPRSAPDSVRSSIDTGSRSSTTSSSGWSLPPFSAISAGVHEERSSTWPYMPPTPMLGRPISSSSASSSPPPTGLLSASYSATEHHWYANGDKRRSSSMATLPLPIKLAGSMRTPTDPGHPRDPIRIISSITSTSPKRHVPQSPMSTANGSGLGVFTNKRAANEPVADDAFLRPDTAKTSIGGWSPDVGR